LQDITVLQFSMNQISFVSSILKKLIFEITNKTAI
jgi:hypothetical protein